MGHPTNRLYFDYNASAPCPEVLEAELLKGKEGAFYHWLCEAYANPSSIHQDGQKTKKLLVRAERAFLENFQIPHDKARVYWTAGATESNNWSIYSVVQSKLNDLSSCKILSSPIEHESILSTLRFWQKKGVQVDYARITNEGILDLEDFASKLQSTKYDLAICMAANNETGAIQPIFKVLELCKQTQTPLHCDSVQILGKMNLQWGAFLDHPCFFSFSGHKVGAPKGVGLLLETGFQKGSLLKTALIHGHQYRGLRGGTENTLGIAAFGFLMENYKKIMLPSTLLEWKKAFEAQILSHIPDSMIHAQNAPRLSNTSYLGFAGIPALSLLQSLDLAGASLSSGSACSSGSSVASAVLSALGQCDVKATASLRVSSGIHTKKEDYDALFMLLEEKVRKLRSK